MERFAVIGLGRFGSRLATNLAAAGAEVIAIDRERSVVEELRDQVTLAIALDATDEQALKIQGVDQVDCAVVGIGQNFEANALTTALLKSLKVQRVIARARNSMQAKILSRIGADGVVSPEDESADRWSYRLLAPFIIDHIELGDGYAIVQIPTPEGWAGKTLSELNLRAQHNVTIVAIKRRVAAATQSGAESYGEHVIDLPQPTSRLTGEDTIVLAGFDRDIKRLPR
ncbi:MAG: TrkA family potassium uptake protein [Planctomycetota bacterium]|nr:TrkA family potassium uptake protein [Planctomycetota bacterium]